MIKKKKKSSGQWSDPQKRQVIKYLRTSEVLFLRVVGSHGGDQFIIFLYIDMS